MPGIKRPDWHNEPPPDPNFPSRSKIKRDYQALTDLALDLVGVPQARLDAIAMDERLREAIAELRKLKNLPARQRQANFVGKLLRDEDIAPFQRALKP